MKTTIIGDVILPESEVRNGETQKKSIKPKVDVATILLIGLMDLIIGLLLLLADKLLS